MSTNTKVSALDHAMHIAHTWINDVATELDTEDREFAYRVLRAWLHTLRNRLPVEASAHFGAQLPDLIRSVFYAGWNPNTVPEKYDAEECTVRFLRGANISLHDIGKEPSPSSPPHPPSYGSVACRRCHQRRRTATSLTRRRPHFRYRRCREPDLVQRQRLPSTV